METITALWWRIAADRHRPTDMMSGHGFDHHSDEDPTPLAALVAPQGGTGFAGGCRPRGLGKGRRVALTTDFQALAPRSLPSVTTLGESQSSAAGGRAQRP